MDLKTKLKANMEILKQEGFNLYHVSDVYAKPEGVNKKGDDYVAFEVTMFRPYIKEDDNED